MYLRTLCMCVLKYCMYERYVCYAMLCYVCMVLCVHVLSFVGCDVRVYVCILCISVVSVCMNLCHAMYLRMVVCVYECVSMYVLVVYV